MIRLSLEIVKIIEEMRENYTYKEIAETIGRTVGIKPPHVMTIRNYDKLCIEKFGWTPKKRVGKLLNRIFREDI